MNKPLSILFILIYISSCGERKWECVSGDCENGYGTAILGEYNEYIGEWKDGLFHGEGILYGSMIKYVGEFKDGMRSGNGISTLAKRGTFTYKYRDNESGKIKDTTMMFKYEGEWRNDFKNGTGTQIDLDGSRYEGGFKDGFKHGKATRTFLDGRVEEGLWENGLLISTYEDE